MTKRMQVNAGGPIYYNGYSMYLNWVKQNGSPDGTYSYTINGVPRFPEWGEYSDSSDVEPTWIAGPYVQANGELNIPCSSDVTNVFAVFYSKSPQLILNEDFSGEKYQLMWDGTATLTVGGCTVDSGTLTSNSARVTLNDGVTQASMSLAVTDTANPPRNLRAVQTRYYDNTAVGNGCTIDGVTYPGWVQGGKFDPNFIHWVKKFDTWRTLNAAQANNSAIANFSEFALEDHIVWQAEHRFRNMGGVNGYYPAFQQQATTRAGMPLAIIRDLVEQASVNLWYCMSACLTDAAAQSLFEWFRDNTDPDRVLKFEYTNEHWNTFRQGYYILGAGEAKLVTDPDFQTSLDDNLGWLWYGYRAAQLAKICYDVFAGQRERYRFVLATHTGRIVTFGGGVYGGVAPANLKGVEYFRANDLSPANSIPFGQVDGVPTGLFDEYAVTGYIGQVIFGYNVTAITKAADGLITYDTQFDVPFVDGQRVHLVMIGPTMSELDDVTVTVANHTLVGGSVYSFNCGVNTTGYTTFANNGFNTVVVPQGAIWDVMDESESRHADNPAAYPTDYDYFSEQLAEAIIDGGTSSGGITLTTAATIAGQIGYWTMHKALADSKGLQLVHYEAGNHYLGYTTWTGNGVGSNAGVDRFNDFMVHAGYHKAIATALEAMYRAFIDLGGVRPSCFVLDATAGKDGTWATIRRWPTVNHGLDDDNPKARMTRAVTGDVKRMRARAA